MRQPLLALTASLWLVPALSAPGAAPPATPAPSRPAPAKPQQAAPATLPDAGTNRTLSESGQFSVIGGSSTDRTEIAKRGDRLWKLFTKTTGLSSQWQHRILVQVYERTNSTAPDRRAVGRIYPIEGGYRFEMNLLLDEEFQWDEFRRELTKLFLLSEIIVINPGRAIQDRIPPWMLAGLHTLLNYRQSGVPSEVFARLLQTRQMLSLSEVLNTVPTPSEDSVSQGLFSACSAVLVRALLQQPNGQVRFRALLGDLGATATGVPELLRQHFPSLPPDPTERETWWNRQITSMSEHNRFAVMSLAETEKRLEELLLVQPPVAAPPGESEAQAPPAPQPSKTEGLILNPFKLWQRQKTPAAGPPGQEPDPAWVPVPLREYGRYLGQPWAKGVLVEKQRQIALLQSQAFPLYHSILGGYQQVMTSLQQGQTKGILPILDRLEAERLAVQQQMRGVEDHINWFSTTQIEGSSHEFDGYSQALKLLEKLDQRKRPDPISRYLDAIERELNR